MAEIYNETVLDDKDGTITDKVGQATRAGSFAFLLYSLVSLSSSFLLPLLISPSGNNKYNSENDNAFTLSLFGKKKYKLTCLNHLKMSFLTLPRAWTLSHFIFCICMLSTILVHDVTAAAVVIGFCGISWATSMWAPFSLLGEYISEQEAKAGNGNERFVYNHADMMTSTASLAGIGIIGTEPAIYHPVANEEDGIELLGIKDGNEVQASDRNPQEEGSRNRDDSEEQQHQQHPEAAAGVLLGIHNMYIVLPQFLVTFFSSILFRVLESEDEPTDTIGIVLRVGAVMAGVAGFISLKIKKD